MPILSIRLIPLFVLAGTLVLTSTGCSESVSRRELRDEELISHPSATSATQARLTSSSSDVSDSESVVSESHPELSPSSFDSEGASNPAPSDPYRQGIDRASSAFTLSRSAQSQDDWSLVARRWQQAVDLMAAVPETDPNHAQAQSKVAEYRTNLSYAQERATRSTAIASSGNITIRSQPAPSPVIPSSPPVAAVALPPTPSVAPTNTGREARAFYAPIVRREGNTPVIQVTFNGNQTFDMIVDTGASGTLITTRMAQSLGVIPVGAARVDTASESGVVVPLGYVGSMEVNGAVAQNVLVAIAGPQLSTGLLGHDFFGNFDVTVREHEVVFRERSGA